MNTKRYLIASVVVAIFIVMFEWFFHGNILAPTYESTAHLWRPKADMHQYMGWMMGGQVLFGFVFSYIFTLNYENKGIAEGIRYGLLIGLLYVPGNLIMYSVVPYPLSLTLAWIAGGFVECAIAGAIAAAIYKK